MAINYYINYTLGTIYPSSFSSANAQLMFTFPTRIFTGEFQALQLIVLVAFGAVD